MKKLFFTFILLIVLASCSKDDNENLDESSTFVIYKQNNTDFGLAATGTKNEFNFKAFGEFKSLQNTEEFVPKDIKFIEQINPNNPNLRYIIKLNNSYLPSEFYEVTNNIVGDTIYHVSYNQERILINHDVLNDDGTFSTYNSTEFNGISVNRNSSINRNTLVNDEDCDDALSEQQENDFHPCSNSSIYQQFANDALNSSYFHYAGVAISWVVESVTENFCDQSLNRSNSSNTFTSRNLTCEDFQISDVIEDICQILQNCQTDCSGELYGSAYLDECSDCVGGNTYNIPCTADTNIFTDLETIRYIRQINNLDISAPQWYTTDFEEAKTFLANNIAETNINAITGRVVSLYYIQELTIVPAEIQNLTELIVLNLPNNNLSNIPNAIGNLSNLTQLGLSGNNISIIPDSIGNLTNLESLSFLDNDLTSVPSSLGNLVNLVILDFEGNIDLKCLPASVWNLETNYGASLGWSGTQITNFGDTDCSN